MRPILLAAAFAACGSAAAAQGRVTAGDCDWLTTMLAIVEPWEDNTRLFYNGEVRVVLADSVEPACCWAHLLILMPNPDDEMGLRQCVAVNLGNGAGFAGLDFAALAARYDPSTGLVISFPYALYDPETGGTGPWRDATVTVNVGAGSVSAR